MAAQLGETPCPAGKETRARIRASWADASRQEAWTAVVEGKHPAQPIVPPAVSTASAQIEPAAPAVATVLVIGAFLREVDHGAVGLLVALVG